MRDAKEPLIYSSPRRKPGSRSLKTLNSGFRRNDGNGLNQRLPKGFSLLEVLVAFLVLALSLAVVMRIFAGGLDNIGAANNYTQALSLAESLLDAQGRESPLVIGETRGETRGETENGLDWQVTVTPYQDDSVAPEASAQPLQLVRVEVIVQWDKERKVPRSLSLSTLRVAARS